MSRHFHLLKIDAPSFRQKNEIYSKHKITANFQQQYLSLEFVFDSTVRVQES